MLRTLTHPDIGRSARSRIMSGCSGATDEVPRQRLRPLVLCQHARMAFRNFAKHPVASAVGFVCGLSTCGGAMLAATGKGALGAGIVIASFSILIAVVVGVRSRQPGDPL